MIAFKCKMCGGTLDIENQGSVAICGYCGTTQTLPKNREDSRINMFDRANHYRQTHEYDKAIQLYDQILNDDPTDAEAYWSLVLCRYGVEYVEDPATHKMIPTVNRTQFTAVTADEDYKAAMQYGDGAQRRVFEEEAKVIDGIQRNILNISRSEEPFDVFICYKETDDRGERTRDSVFANDIYHHLTNEGYKVFFSRITLESKLGTAYEPYIFAALNSAKVMIVLGTKPEYFNAVWVKNEWSRYIALMKRDSGKTLIPAYRDMDPYDLPAEFSYLQSLDMGKLGFLQDLIYGIRKILPKNQKSSPEPEPIIAAPEQSRKGFSSQGHEALLRRAMVYLGDGDFDSAKTYAKDVLDVDPERGEAYYVLLMSELGITDKRMIATHKVRISGLDNYKKYLRYCPDDKLEIKKCAELNDQNYLARIRYMQRYPNYGKREDLQRQLAMAEQRLASLQMPVQIKDPNKGKVLRVLGIIFFFIYFPVGIALYIIGKLAVNGTAQERKLYKQRMQIYELERNRRMAEVQNCRARLQAVQQIPEFQPVSMD